MKKPTIMAISTWNINPDGPWHILEMIYLLDMSDVPNFKGKHVYSQNRLPVTRMIREPKWKI
jgi:hypothetical protein